MGHAITSTRECRYLVTHSLFDNAEHWASEVIKPDVAKPDAIKPDAIKQGTFE
jgi:hypothetical protein